MVRWVGSVAAPELRPGRARRDLLVVGRATFAPWSHQVDELWHEDKIAHRRRRRIVDRMRPGPSGPSLQDRVQPSGSSDQG